MTEMLPAFTGDIIMEYAFGFSYNQLASPNFESFHEAFVATLQEICGCSYMGPAG